MNVLIPMAGAGSRFAEAGYTSSKPLIPVTDRRTGEQFPMVVAATRDLPECFNQEIRPIYVDRDFHKAANVQERIKEYYKDSRFITINKLTEGQASTCLLAKDLIDNEDELLIGACDNGMDFNEEKFIELKSSSDVLAFTFRHNLAVEQNPKAYGWVKVASDDKTIKGVSVKIPISEKPLEDHAIVGAFWFRRGCDFVKATERMIAAEDRINNEFYVDQVLKYVIEMDLKAKVFEIDRYLCWGTPQDYQNYEKTLAYWTEYVDEEEWV